VSRAEVVAALSLATDVAMGQPLESGLQICVLARALAQRAGLDDAECARVHYVAQLRHVGCTAENDTFGALVGEEHVFRHGAAAIEINNPRVMFAYTMRHLVRQNGLLGAAAKLAQMAAARDRMQESVLAVCEVAQMLADRLGLGQDVQADLLMTTERWDGKSFLKQAEAEAIPAPVRVVQIAECVTVYRALEGVDAAREVVRDRAGGSFDPQLAEVFTRNADELCAEVDEASVWDAVVGSAPSDDRVLEGEELDGALSAMAEFVDLKSPFTVGHSPGVAQLAGAAAEHAGLPADDVTALRHSALVHDIGRVGVPSMVWEKRGALSPDDWERVRLHPYLGERMLSRSPALKQLSAVAALHHERCDGSGYHRGLDGGALPPAAKLLAAADAFHAMTEPRPHREPMTLDAAAAEIRGEARAGRLDGDAVTSVLAAAGQAPRRRRDGPAGLTAREVEVLRLLARGLATKQIASALVISPKTADSHIQHIYSKVGVSTRAAATVFAMRHGLAQTLESSGELPM
jgi:HD-GYP domain-containing protein (c-di-GMP phosphodiesterase class II)